MSYQEDFEKAQKAGATEEVTRSIQSWHDEGDFLVGKVIAITPFEEGTFDTEVQCYLFDTDGGRISTVLGSATDKQLEEIEIIGKLVHIEYRGKKTIADGKQVNVFKVTVF